MHTITDDTTLFPRNRQPTIRNVAMPADTNPAGAIFGGWVMSQIDLAGSIVAVEYANSQVATVAVASMEFHKPIYVGDLVSCFAKIEKIGATSLTIKIEVFAQRGRNAVVQCVKVTEAVIVYVAVDSQGNPQKLPQRGPTQSEYF